MNRVPLARRVQVINCLVEGNSIRSTERMTGTHRDTICRLLVEVGDGCAKLMDEQMRELSCRRIEVDEIWAYVGKKQRHLTPLDDPRLVGDQYTFVALDPETKIVPAYRVGKRDRVGQLSPRGHSGFVQCSFADQHFMCGAECIEAGRDPAIGRRMQQGSFDLLDSNAVVERAFNVQLNLRRPV